MFSCCNKSHLCCKLAKLKADFIFSWIFFPVEMQLLRTRWQILSVSSALVSYDTLSFPVCLSPSCLCVCLPTCVCEMHTLRMKICQPVWSARCACRYLTFHCRWNITFIYCTAYMFLSHTHTHTGQVRRNVWEDCSDNEWKKRWIWKIFSNMAFCTDWTSLLNVSLCFME